MVGVGVQHTCKHDPPGGIDLTQVCSGGRHAGRKCRSIRSRCSKPVRAPVAPSRVSFGHRPPGKGPSPPASGRSRSSRLCERQPPSSEAHLGVFENLHHSGAATVAELTGERLHQALHVIDLRTFQCVTLLNTIPDKGMNIVDEWDAQELQDDDAMFYTSAQNYMMRDHTVDRYPLTRPGQGGSRDAGFSLVPFLGLRPTLHHSLPGDSDDLPPLRADYRLLFADFVLEPRPPLDWYDEYYTDRTRFIHKAEDFCEFVAEVIRQTHRLCNW